MKILVIGDCHGRPPEIPEREFDIILAVGDICGGTEEMRQAMFKTADTEDRWYDELESDRAKKQVDESIEEGLAVLERLQMQDKQVFLVPGNWDWTDTDWSYLEDKGLNQMIEGFENIHNINYECREFEDLSFIGYGLCSGPEFPQYEDDMPDSREELEKEKQEFENIKEEMRDLFEDAENSVIFLSHNVPNDTELDEIKNEDSPKHGRHYGSLVVRSTIEEFSPYYNLAGHMHEGEGRTTIGSTLCINTGLHNTLLIDTETDEIEKF